MNREIEFDIDALSEEAGRVFVTGRCSKGPILCGDTFTTKYRLNFPNAPRDFSLSIRSCEKEATVVVKAIRVFDRPIEELSSGVGAKLELQGADAHSLSKGDFLGNKKSNG